MCWASRRDGEVSVIDEEVPCQEQSNLQRNDAGGSSFSGSFYPSSYSMTMIAKNPRRQRPQRAASNSPFSLWCCSRGTANRATSEYLVTKALQSGRGDNHASS